ncbi:auxin response factor 23-like isoform X1 [Actinidia eriantha]|uniref:auxin response factor 23-like isoform X1 n=1 Tax=Actinidia eriantha TaxID=165200 RepID=UPI002586E556|nr:auxin response factor 23-like isoform X1 [Actinidia eriantha]
MASVNDVQVQKVETINDGSHCNHQGEKDDLYTQLWHACAGPLVNVPRVGDKVFYFPQGHTEQVEAYANKDGKVEMPVYNLPFRILCKVVYVQLKAEAQTDEVFAQITLLPEQEGPSSEHETSQSVPQKVNSCSFSKRLTPSDISTHGGFSVPKRYADECFPSLDMSHDPPAQELVAKDLHGLEWRFRHIYRGQPKRHLLTSGWSIFVGAKKVVAGDACIFLRGEHGELYIGVRRVSKPQTIMSTSVISGHIMQHGILASAFHAISTGTMFTVYYRPWTSPAEFIIPRDQYTMSAENDYSVGTRFRMQFESEECPEHKYRRFAGTVVGIDNIDPIRWAGSEWRCLKVQWDSPPDTIVLPERVSPWNIEPMVKKKKCNSLLPHRKRASPRDPSALGFPVVVQEGFLKGSIEYTQKRPSGVLQGQEIRGTGACAFGSSSTQPNSDWHHRLVGLENQLPFQMHGPFSRGSTISVPSGIPPNLRLTSYWPSTFTLTGVHCVEVSKSGSFPKVNSSSSVSQDWKASEEKKDEVKSPLDKPIGNDKCMLFGVNIFSSPPEVPSPQVVSSTELHSLCPAPPLASHSSISEPIQISEPSKSISGNLLEKQCKNSCSNANRSCTKVLKYGTALGRSVDLTRFDGYGELICELDQMFDFNGTLIDKSSGWYVAYTDGEGDMMLTGDYPWPEFQAMVCKMFICPKEDGNKLDPSSPDPPSL